MPMIDIPLSPRFLLAVTDGIPQYHSTVVMPAFVATASEIKEMLKKEQAKKDVGRTFWGLPGRAPFINDNTPEQLELCVNSPGQLKELSENGYAGSPALQLSDNDVLALYAAALSDGKFNDKHELSAEQGGLVRGGAYLRMQSWLMSYALMENADRQDYPVNRINSTTLLITQEGQSKKIRMDDTQFEHPKYRDGYEQDSNWLEFQYHVELGQAHDKKDSYLISIDKERYTFRLDEELFKNVILPQALHRLTQKNELTNDDLFHLIPCLVDENFRREFAKRLANENDDIKKQANEWIVECFAQQPAQLRQIKNTIKNEGKSFFEINKKEIIFGVIAAVLIAAVAGAAVAFLAPAVIAAAGVVGLVAATTSLAIIVSGMAAATWYLGGKAINAIGNLFSKAANWFAKRKGHNADETSVQKNSNASISERLSKNSANTEVEEKAKNAPSVPAADATVSAKTSQLGMMSNQNHEPIEEQEEESKKRSTSQP